MLIRCSGCTKTLKLPEHAPGKIVACPVCSRRLKVPETPFYAHCQHCAAKLAVRPKLAGERVACPKCAQSTPIPILLLQAMVEPIVEVLPGKDKSNAIINEGPVPKTSGSDLSFPAQNNVCIEGPTAVTDENRVPCDRNDESKNIDSSNPLPRPEALPVSGEVLDPPITMSRSRDFFRDLRCVFREYPSPPTPDESVSRLASIFENNRKEKHLRKTSFERDLRAVLEGYTGIFIGQLDDAKLLKLADTFLDWRKKVTDEVGRYFDSIPSDDPLLCPIGLFGIFQYGRIETAHTRMLAWLLDPTKEHGFGDRLLRSLLVHLVGTHALGRIKVEKTDAEFIIDNGRLDILVRGKFVSPEEEERGWLLLIEAKIDANEAEDQLWKYERWANKLGHHRQVFRMFLTPEGRSPITAKEPWTPVSFSQLACIFRAVCPELRDQPGFHFLKHYLSGILKDICRWQLPIQDPRTCEDVYSVVEYLRIVTVSTGVEP